VRLEETVTFVEMTSPDELVPGRPSPRPVEMRPQDRSAADLVKDLNDRVGGPYQWTGLARTVDDWRRSLARPDTWHWIPTVDDEPAGLLIVVAHAGGESEIDTFGLVPEFVGRGFGGHALTLSVRLAWAAEPLNAPAVRRVWLHTSTRDHPNALANYRARGFRPFRTDVRVHDVADT
jgi:GNAT superfamily N-acetyltransferase